MDLDLDDSTTRTLMLLSAEKEAATHRKNHRSGIKERARRDKKALNGDSIPGTPGSTTSFEYDGKKKGSGHRAGVKVRARRERDAFSMTKESLDMESDGEVDYRDDSQEEGEDDEAEEVEDADEKDREDELDQDVENTTDANIDKSDLANAMAGMEVMNATMLGESHEESSKEHGESEKEIAKEKEDSMEEAGQAKENEMTDEAVAQLTAEVIHAHYSSLEEKAPSLTYDSDDHSADEVEDDSMPEPAIAQELSSLRSPVRLRADTGSFQAKAEKDLELSNINHVVEDSKAQDTIQTVKQLPPPAPRVKHEVKLLSLQRVVPLKGGTVPVATPIKHEVKLLGLQRVVKLKGGDLKTEIGAEGTKLLGLKGVIKLKQGDIV